MSANILKPRKNFKLYALAGAAALAIAAIAGNRLADGADARRQGNRRVGRIYRPLRGNR